MAEENGKKRHLVTLNAALEQEKLLALVKVLGPVVNNRDDSLNLLKSLVGILVVGVGLRGFLQNFPQQERIFANPLNGLNQIGLQGQLFHLRDIVGDLLEKKVISKVQKRKREKKGTENHVTSWRALNSELVVRYFFSVEPAVPWLLQYTV